MSHSESVRILPQSQVVDRISFLRDSARGRSVIHLGFFDVGWREMQTQYGAWLHAELAKVASSLIGIDYDAEAVRAANSEGYTAYAADCRDPEAIEALGIEPADVVIAGELIEHLDSPGPFLDGAHSLVKPGGSLLITTPNGVSPTGVIAAGRGYEAVNSDHVALYSWFTLQNLLERHGWEVSECLTYLLPQRATGRPLTSLSVGDLIARGLIYSQRRLARWRSPFLADGLIMVCRELNA